MSRRGEQAERSLPAQAVVDREMPRYPPRILRVQRQSLHALRKVSVARRRRRSSIRVVNGKLRQIRGTQRVKRRIVGKRVQRLLIPRECARQHRLVNEIHSALKRMIALGVSQTVTELILLLIAQRRK